jgi:NAD-dependent deacetylase
VLTETQIATIDDIAASLRTAGRILFVTGAGVSADSGLPTYRGIGGLYDGTLTEDGVAIEDALSGGMMTRAPEITWKYLLQIERACRGAHHNRAHEVVAALEDWREAWVLTQNIDGFHRAAGSRNLIEIHGDLYDLRCLRCEHRFRVASFEDLSVPPVCSRCGAPCRPDVVLFGEMLPTRAVDRLTEELARGFDAVFSVGTSSVFPYIAAPMAMAAEQGWLSVEINPVETRVSPLATHRIRAGAAETLDALWSRVSR